MYITNPTLAERRALIDQFLTPDHSTLRDDAEILYSDPRAMVIRRNHTKVTVWDTGQVWVDVFTFIKPSPVGPCRALVRWEPAPTVPLRATPDVPLM